MHPFAHKITQSRKALADAQPAAPGDAIQEGGCGVVGFAASVPVGGRHIFAPSIQMHNRGNGKGGGIAAAGLVPSQLGVDADTLREDYLLQIALLDPACEKQVEQEFVAPFFNVDHRAKLQPTADFRELGLEVRPPDIVRYFVRVKDDALRRFMQAHDMSALPARAAEDEFVYQNTFNLNKSFYASLGEKRAFVLSHARNLMILKIVGYAEQVVQYYGLDDIQAHVWIAHQRYPTKGRVWHPAGAHPFIGMNEALVHNGDFANYYSISEYLRQHNVVPLFLTDTEVSVLLFDLLHRVYRYPVEYVIEALAPTTELDFQRLPPDKQRTYRLIQAAHMHGSPDGPWFFIIARTEPEKNRLQLLGITDTAMLRPQVFALQEGDVSIGLVASEKQAIDATLASLAASDGRFRRVADRYWNARGGSHTDGGAFSFTVTTDNGQAKLTCADKFGREIACPPGAWDRAPQTGAAAPKLDRTLTDLLTGRSGVEDAEKVFAAAATLVAAWDFAQVEALVKAVVEAAARDRSRFEWALRLLSLLNDRRYDCGGMKRSVVLEIVRDGLTALLDGVPSLDDKTPSSARRIDWATRDRVRPPAAGETTLVVDAREFQPEGVDCDSRLEVRAYGMGWKRFIVYGLQGQRFTGCGLGPETSGVRIDVYGSSGDYLASGIDGMELHVHDNAQDQVGQILKSGTLVIHGDVGQTFMYGAKGGEIYIMGNAAGRPLINAAGRPRVVVNGTSLDFLAESFMAGDPHKGGGFVILNGIEFDDRGSVRSQEMPYPGSNLFSLASGGAIFVRDPHHKVVAEQLNGGEFAEFTSADWELILPYLQANARHFGIAIERDLLTVDGTQRPPHEVYRKVRAVKLAVLAKEEVPE